MGRTSRAEATRGAISTAGVAWGLRMGQQGPVSSLGLPRPSQRPSHFILFYFSSSRRLLRGSFSRHTPPLQPRRVHP